eukprot:1579452-Prymnesium_polylepis.2
MMLSQRLGNLHEPQHHVASIVKYIRTVFPFYNRSRGTDHVVRAQTGGQPPPHATRVMTTCSNARSHKSRSHHDRRDAQFFTTQDLGGCVLPVAIKSSIIVSLFGFTQSLATWMSSDRWQAAAEEAIPSADAQLGANDPFRPLASGQISDSGKWSVARDWERSCRVDARSTSCHRWQGACFDREKDVVAPPDNLMATEVLRATERDVNAASSRGRWCVERKRKQLIFVSGSLGDEGRREYNMSTPAHRWHVPTP